MSAYDFSPYLSPDAAMAAAAAWPQGHPPLCWLEEIGRSTQGRPIHAIRIGPIGAARPRPRLLITAQIHAVEFIGSYVARRVAERLLSGYGKEVHITALLDAADVWVVPLLNPDGAQRIWDAGGISSLGGARFTANGVDPNRNFPFVESEGRSGWNSARATPGSAYYRGPHPLSEPECLALARLCERERFCAAINFHSFSAVVFMPEVSGPDAAKAQRVLDVFNREFQSHQPHRRYRPIPERSAKIEGQLDPFLLNAFGTPSVTVEVSRLGWHLLNPARLRRIFWWANPRQADYWADNDCEATVHALIALLERSGGTPCEAAEPQLASWATTRSI